MASVISAEDLKDGVVVDGVTGTCAGQFLVAAGYVAYNTYHIDFSYGNVSLTGSGRKVTVSGLPLSDATLCIFVSGDPDRTGGVAYTINGVRTTANVSSSVVTSIRKTLTVPDIIIENTSTTSSYPDICFLILQ